MWKQKKPALKQFRTCIISDNVTSLPKLLSASAKQLAGFRWRW